jgi:putative DNA primase/helicase
MVRWPHGKSPNDKKETRPYIFDIQRNKWKSKFPATPRSPYNFTELLARPDAVVLIVEGEKSVEAAKILFHDYVVITSSGGANGSNSTDWSYLKDREIIISPDFDAAGKQYFTRVKNLCVKAEAKSIKELFTEKLGRFIVDNGVIVERQGEVPAKYDLADSLADGWCAELINSVVNDKKLDLFTDQENSKDQPILNHIQSKIEQLHQLSSYNEIKEVLALLLPYEELEREFYLRQIQKKAKQQMRSLRKIIKKLVAVEKAKKAEQYKIIQEEKRKAFEKSDTVIALDQPLDHDIWINLTEKNTPKSTLANFKMLLKAYGFAVKYNTITRRCEKTVSTKKYKSDNQDNNIRADITSVCILNNFKITETTINAYLGNIAEENIYNPIAEWIASKPWDGRSRLQELSNTVITDTPNKELYLKKWLLSAVAAANMEKGFFSKGVLVFQGGQSIGKTSWFKKLLPPEMHDLLLEGASIDPSSKDSVIKVVRRWLVELGELDATFRKADIAKLKAFISNEEDTIRLPYAQEESRFTRRTVFFASVNEKYYLVDNTGNTRWWTLAIKDIDYKHNIDMQQLWAECSVLLKNGEQWWFTPEEEKLLELNNNDFLSVSPFEELLQAKYNFSKPANTPITATELLVDLGYLNPNKKQRNEMGQVLQKLGVTRNRLSKYLIPPVYDVTEKNTVDNHEQYDELKNKQKLQILNNMIHRNFKPYEASIIINECNFKYTDNKLVLTTTHNFNLDKEHQEQLEYLLKDLYGNDFMIMN